MLIVFVLAGTRSNPVGGLPTEDTTFCRVSVLEDHNPPLSVAYPARAFVYDLRLSTHGSSTKLTNHKGS